jgi:hypothetical protein
MAGWFARSIVSEFSRKFAAARDVSCRDARPSLAAKFFKQERMMQRNCYS